MKQKHKSSRHRGLKNTILVSVIIFLAMTVSYAAIYYIRTFLYKHGLTENIKTYVGIRNVFLAIESIFVGTVISSIVARYFLNPLDEATEVLEAIGERNFNVKMHKRKRGKKFDRLSQTINNTVDELSSVELLRTDFVNNFSHEFKTPIVSIEGFAKVIKEGNLTKEEENEFLDIIIAESERLTKMSSDMLLLSYVEKTGSIGEVARCNISEQIRKAIADLYTHGAGRKIGIDFEGGEIYAECSEELMNYVWKNLLDNAVKYAGENPEIRVTAKKKNGNAVITVSDNGRGIPQEDIPHIFEKFYRSSYSSEGVRGTGIGLATVKKITDLHSGTIEVESQPGKGSTFTVSIPEKKTE